MPDNLEPAVKRDSIGGLLMHVLLDHPAVGGVSSHFALSQTKHTTAMPV